MTQTDSQLSQIIQSIRLFAVGFVVCNDFLGPEDPDRSVRKFDQDIYIWAAPSETGSSHVQNAQNQIHTAHAQSHSRICSLLIHSVMSSDSVSGRQRPRSDCADAQADLGLRFPHMP